MKTFSRQVEKVDRGEAPIRSGPPDGRGGKARAGVPAARSVGPHGGTSMALQLRVFEEPEGFYEPTPDPTVRVRLGDLLPLVAMAQKLNFIWLKDFLDDEVCITEDLHQVLQTFRGCRPSA